MHSPHLTAISLSRPQMPEKRRKNSSADVMADADGASAAPAPTKDSKGRKFITRADVAKHSDRDDMWFVIEGKVYGVSKYLEDHPGGEEVLLDRAGADATEDFEDVGHSQQARDTLKKYELGELPPSERKASGGGGGGGGGGGSGGLIGVVVLLAAVAAGMYFFFQEEEVAA